ncbi:hypothetical protein [Mycolicibacterium llatzerense]|uniref:hypothetical protein n=1 Tax=Mycolicibacterium llatzerense TaxID=280871 RepID=UPI0021B58B8A|nr:hypothetical protein [Mycolicibacterium llatzerense]MCT7373160.1 hypothetical protein [Mycolicibacterium llatzerense]
MSSTADRIKANAERLRAKTPAKPVAAADSEPPAVVTDVPTPRAAATVRQKNVRRTVDLSPTAHRALDAWQSQAAERLGLARVTGQQVLAVLVDRLLNDAELAEQVTQAIAADR